MEGRLKSLKDLEIEAGIKPSKIETKKKKAKEVKVSLGKVKIKKGKKYE